MSHSMTRRTSILRTVLLTAVPVLLLAKGGEVRMKTGLTGGTIAGLTPSGHADFRATPAQGRARLNVEVEDVNLAPGTLVDVFIDGSQVGSSTIGAAPVRGGELELNSQDGQTVPSVSAGAVVVVRNGSAAILSGVLN